MKILLIHPHDLAYVPWGIRPLGIARSLSARGHKVRLIHFLDNNRRQQPPQLRNPEEYVNDALQLKPNFRHIAASIKIVAQRANWADVIHFQKASFNAALPALWASLLKKKPLHYDWDDLECWLSWEAGSRATGVELAIYERVLCSIADTVSVSSAALRQKALKWGGDGSRVFYVPVGADAVKFHLPSKNREYKKKFGGGPVVVYVGQMEFASYADHVLKAVPIIVKIHPNVRFVMVGKGHKLNSIRARIEEEGLGENVMLAGAVEADEIPPILSAADIAVATFEDNAATRCKSPLKIVEYMAAGLPVVVSDVGDAAVMAGPAGLVARPDDPDDLARKINRLLSDEKLREKMGREGRKRVEKIYNWDKAAETLEMAYIKAIEHQRGAI